MKKFIAFILAFSLLVSSVAAADVYDIRPDTNVSLMSSAYDVALTSVTQSELDDTLSSYLEWSSKSVARYLYDIYQYIPHLADIRNALVSSASNSPFWASGAYLNASGSSSYPSSSQSFTNIFRQGFLGLSANIQALADEMGVDYSTVLSNILTAVQSVNTSVGSVDTSVGMVESAVTGLSPVITALGPVVTAPLISTYGAYLDSYGNRAGGSGNSVSDLLSYGFLGIGALMKISSGSGYLGSTGSMAAASSDMSFSNMTRLGLLGLSSLITADMGQSFLLSDGTQSITPYDMGLEGVARHGFLGLRSLISGAQSDNVYSGSYVGNDGTAKTFSVRGLGPMLNTYFSAIGHTTGLLSYMFASPQDLEMKKNSESNMSAVDDSFLSSDSTSGVKVTDITDISSASDSIQALGQTGVTPGQAFDQLDDSSLFSFFTAETAANLDTTVTTYSRDPHTQIVTNYYEQSRFDFFDLIGKEGDG